MTTRKVELIEKKKFAAAGLNLEHKAFIVYIAILDIDLGDEVYPSKEAQIAHLKANKAFIKVFSKYINFVDIFSSKLAVELLEYTKINNHVIKLVDN